MSKKGEEPKKYYWDSCVFLSAINKNTDRVGIIENILDDCERGKIEIYTSLLSIVEVAFAQGEKDAAVLDKETLNKIDKLWHPPSPIKLIEVHEFVIWAARDLLRKSLEDNRGLKPADAIHIATANRLPIDIIHTYDDKLMKYSTLAKVSIQEPTVTDRFVFKCESDEENEQEIKPTEHDTQEHDPTSF